MTTFTSRKTIRDDIAGLITTNGSWQNVYSGMPNFSDDIAGRSPLCTVLSSSTATEFAGENVNPRTHSFLVTNWVVYSVDRDSWTYNDAEDLLDTLEFTLAQVIRDNAAGSGVADSLEFDGLPSTIDRTEIQNVRYIRETFTVIARLATGAL